MIWPQIFIWNNSLSWQENGIDAWWLQDSVISGNNASHNFGWGIHLSHSTNVSVVGNVANYCDRPHIGNSAGILLVKYGALWYQGERERERE